LTPALVAVVVETLRPPARLAFPVAPSSLFVIHRPPTAIGPDANANAPGWP
ncbi:hypothetical protein EJ04DRAFT_463771, partial [Polyplosphaeria fusca]